ncbi:sialin-like [Pomacea canaliculata]|uniref:sialin-like n=1 Tax=Pomacea canaliculata TaxID=400727 RepID=UPI000D72C3B8|nr:sialin-like [Pomacea canaliculata]XP_025081541.1 sialin-like [Pomacea canaliculata]XP_025081542.1 sialin-like [Pomacea canaliculata]
MVKNKDSAPSNKSSSSGKEDDACGSLNVKQGDEGEFDWSKGTQGQILGAFFYGYLLLQLPGGILSQSMGSKVVISVGMGTVAIMTLLSPVFARINPYGLFAVRVIIGLGQGVMYPAAISFWGAWAPPKERTRLVAISLSGGQLGNALIFPAGGLICHALGWDYVFYYSGTLGSIFVLIWMAWVKDDPHDHDGLDMDERLYLYSVVHTAETKGLAIPWKAIFTSAPTWAVFIAHTTGNYTYYMNLTQIPTYMKEILKFDLKANGFFSMLPYLVFWFTTFASGIFSDWLIGRGISITVVRKSFAAIGLLGPALSLMLTSLVTCEYKYMAVLTLCFAGGFTGFGFSSYMINHGDLAPCFAGMLFGISNTFATIPGIFAPTIVGKITSGGTVAQWQTAFGIAASLNVIGAITFVLLGQADIQPWAMEKPSNFKVFTTRPQGV